jgi:hypothetical protein
MNTEMNLRVLYNAGKFLSSLATGGLSRRAQLHGVSLLVVVPIVFNKLGFVYCVRFHSNYTM